MLRSGSVEGEPGSGIMLFCAGIVLFCAGIMLVCAATECNSMPCCSVLSASAVVCSRGSDGGGSFLRLQKLLGELCFAFPGAAPRSPVPANVSFLNAEEVCRV